MPFMLFIGLDIVMFSVCVCVCVWVGGVHVCVCEAIYPSHTSRDCNRSSLFLSVYSKHVLHFTVEWTVAGISRRKIGDNK